jgi:hypothetical protein
MTRLEETHLKHPNMSRPIPGDQNNDKRYVLLSLAALVAIFGFFFAVGRVDFATLVASDKSSPQAETTGQARSGGSSSLPKGPASQ